ncbi:MAG: hypothetical protein ACXQTN_05170, partial [Methanoculleaceae archaeon]
HHIQPVSPSIEEEPCAALRSEKERLQPVIAAYLAVHLFTMGVCRSGRSHFPQTHPPCPLPPPSITAFLYLHRTTSPEYI